MLIEIATDENGKILWEKPYPFRSLFKKGQLQIVNYVEYRILSCEKKNNIIRTILKILSEKE